MSRGSADIIVIGGSSGSIPLLLQMLAALPAHFTVPIVIVVHRMKNVKSDLSSILSARQNVYEPEDKEPIREGCIYLAPQNYHLLVEEDGTFSLDYSESVHFSRPSIDVTFMCLSAVYKKRMMAILLSGANRDGADGVGKVIERGGRAIILDPAESEYPAMPAAALDKYPHVEICTLSQIVNILSKLQ